MDTLFYFVFSMAVVAEGEASGENVSELIHSGQVFSIPGHFVRKMVLILKSFEEGLHLYLHLGWAGTMWGWGGRWGRSIWGDGGCWDTTPFCKVGYIPGPGRHLLGPRFLALVGRLAGTGCCDASGQGGLGPPLSLSTTLNPPLAGLGHSLHSEGCKEALTVPRCPTNPFPWLLPMLGRLTLPEEVAPSPAVGDALQI